MIEGKLICDIRGPKKSSTLCCGGTKPYRITGHTAVDIRFRNKSNASMTLLIPGTNLPRPTNKGMISHDNCIFFNARLFDDDDEEIPGLLCAVISPYQNLVVLYCQRKADASGSSFNELQGAAQLSAYIKQAFIVDSNATVQDTGSGLLFNGVYEQNRQIANAPLENRNRTLAELQAEFWATCLVMEALLWNPNSALSPGAVGALRCGMDSVSRMEKVQAIASWAQQMGDPSLSAQLNEEQKLKMEIQLEKQKQEMEQQKKNMEIEREMIELKKQQRDLDAQRMAMGMTYPASGPSVPSPTMPGQSPYYPQVMPATVPMVQPVMVVEHCHDGGRSGWNNGGFMNRGYGRYGGNYGDHHHGGRSGGGIGTGIAAGLGAGIMGALITDAFLD